MFEVIKSKTPSLTSVVGVVAAMIVVLLVYGAWQFLWPRLGVDALKVEDLSGKLVYSGILKEGEVAPKTYSIKFQDGKTEEINETKKFNLFSSSFIEFASSDNENDIFFNSYLSTDNKDGSTVMSKTVFHAVLPDKLDTLAQESAKQFGPMSWSPLKKLLARAVLIDENADSAEIVSASNWKVVITDDTGTVVEEILGATNPTWMPNSVVLLLLRSDGVYAYDTDSGAELRIINISNENQSAIAEIGTMFDVSPDGSRLILTTPGYGTISVYEVSATMDIKKLYSHNNNYVTYSWPVVSPDGKAFAVLTRDIKEQGVSNSRIELYSTEDPNFTMITSLSLDDYNPERVYLDDWIK